MVYVFRVHQYFIYAFFLLMLLVFLTMLSKYTYISNPLINKTYQIECNQPVDKRIYDYSIRNRTYQFIENNSVLIRHYNNTHLIDSAYRNYSISNDLMNIEACDIEWVIGDQIIIGQDTYGHVYILKPLSK